MALHPGFLQAVCSLLEPNETKYDEVSTPIAIATESPGFPDAIVRAPSEAAGARSLNPGEPTS